MSSIASELTGIQNISFKKLLVGLFISICISSSALAQDLQVSNITNPAAANGTYIKQAGTQYTFSYWIHTSGNYCIYKHQYAGGDQHYYWNIDQDYDDVNVYFYSQADGIDSPAGLTYTASGSSTGAVTVTEISTSAEIDITGNATSIASGDVTPTFVDYTKFGSADVSGETLTRTFTISNTGTVNLTLDGVSPYVSISGTNASDFSVTSAPSTPIAGSGLTNFTITFNPSGEGSRTATLSIANSDANEDPYTFGIEGSGFTPKNVVVSGVTTPSAANGTYVHQGTINRFEYWKHESQNYYLFNDEYSNARYWYLDVDTDDTDDDYLYYKLSDDASPVALTGWTAHSGVVGALAVASATPSPEINLQGNGENISDGDNTPSFDDHTIFGSLNISSGTRTRTFTIQNLGSQTLTLSGSSPYVAVSGSGFSVTTPPSNSIAAYSSTTFVVTFDPSVEQTNSATLTITSNDADEATYNFDVQGWGFSPQDLKVTDITNPAAANGVYVHQGLLNELEYWKHESLNYYIYNGVYNSNPYWNIDTDTNPSSVLFYSADHNQDYLPMNVASWTTSGGSGTPTIVYNGPEISVEGNATEIVDGDTSPSADDDTDFGSVGVASGTESHIFTIKNSNSETLNLGANAVSVTGGQAGDFSVTTQPATTVAGNSSTTFTIEFDPSAGGTRSTTVSINNDDSDENPYTFSIQGIGMVPPTVSTSSASDVSTTSATLGGNVTSDGGATVSERGIVYSTSDDTPEIGDAGVTKDDNGSGTGTFSESIGSLSQAKRYYFQAYAINSQGTSYGGVQQFVTKNTITSITRSGSTPTNSATVTWDVTFVADVTGLTADNFSLVQTGISGASITAGLGGSGKNWTVTANTGTGTGTLGLNLDDDSIINAPMSNVPYTGEVYTIDRTDPTLSSSVPADDADNATLGGDIVLTFNDNMAKGTGNITIRKSDDSIFEQIPVGDVRVTINSNQVTINPTATFVKATSYYIEIDATALDDVAGNSFAGISGSSTLNFTTVDIVINEVVTEPKSDWSTNDFDGTDGGGAVTDYDEWIELLINSESVNLTGWTIELLDGSDIIGSLASSGAFVISSYFGTGSFTDTDAGDYLVLGRVNGGVMSNDITINLKDPSGTLVNSATFDGTQSSVSNSSDIYDESAQRYPDGNEWTQGQASMGSTNTGPSVTLSVSSSTISENNTSTTVTATLSAASSQSTTINLTTSGTATSGTDYSLTSSTITIDAGNTTGTTTVTSIQDTRYEADETVILDISSVSNGTESGTQQQTITISNDDSQPSVTLSLTNSPLDEDGGEATVTATLSNLSYQTVTVDLGFTGTATNTSDYTRSGTSITINSGSSTGTITLTGVNDALDEDAESIIVDITGVTNGSENGTQQVTATIIDDDNAPTISINDASVTEGDGSAVNLTFTVSLTAASGKTITVDYATAAGTATSGTDFTAITTTTLTFTPGQTSKTVNVSILGDLTDEPTESLSLNLSNASNATISDGQGDGLILDNDPVATFSINDVTVTEGNSGTVNAVFTVTLTPASGYTTTVNFATANNTAVSGADYNSTSGTLTFDPGTTSKSITVQVNGDLIDEIDETYYVNLSSASNASITDNQGIGTITDDDGEPTVTLSMTGSPFAENGGTATVTATLSAVSEKNATINLGFNGTATNTTDYTRSNTSITINAGSTTGSITLTGVNDSDDDDNETVIIDITGTTNCTESTEQQVTAVITDDENPEIALTGNGNNIPDGDDSPSTAKGTDFGNTDLTAGDVTHIFTITNSGTGAMHLSGTPPNVVITGHTSDFTLITDASTPIAKDGGTTTFSIRFDPTVTGLRTAVVTIVNDDLDENPFAFEIQGTGGNYPEIKLEYNGTEIVDADATPSTADGTDFGYDLFGYSAYSPVHTFQIINLGSGTLNLGGTPRVTVSGTDFSLEQDAPTSVTAGDTTEFKVKFAATATVVRNGTVSITNDDSGENPYNFSITGTGYAGSLMIVQGGSPQQDIENGDTTPCEDDYTNFGRTTITGGTIDRTFEIENFGSGSLALSGTPKVDISGVNAAEFSVILQPGATIAAGSNDIFKIQFDPDSPGTKTATVTIVNDDPNRNPYTFAIQGDGGTPPTGADDAITIEEDQSHTFAVADFTFNDADNDDFAGIKIESLETAGILKYNGSDVTVGLACPDVTFLIFTPEQNAYASPYATFTFKVKDDQEVYSDAVYTMTINVNPAVDPPVIVTNSGCTVEEGGTIVLSDAMLKSSDPDGDDALLTYSVTSGPNHGSLIGGLTQNDIANGELSYSHDGSEAPTDLFKFVVKDDDGGISDTAIFAITVNGINDPPVFSGLPEYVMNEDEELEITRDSILYFISDPDDPDSLLIITFSSCCEDINITPSGNVYNACCTENWCGTGMCIIAVSDGEYTIDTMINITVISVNDLPVLSGLPQALEFIETSSGILDLNGIASDIETPDSLLVFSFSVEPDSVNTSYSTETGILTLTSSAGFTGTATLTVTVTDGDGGAASEIIYVTVNLDPTGIERLDGIPEEYVLFQNYPNPFNPVTKIRFGLPEESEVILKIYDILGREVVTLINSTQRTGYYNYNWNAADKASGIYFYVLTTHSSEKDFREIKKMLLIK